MADTVKALAEIDDGIRRNREVANMLEELLGSLNCGEGASDGQ